MGWEHRSILTTVLVHQETAPGRGFHNWIPAVERHVPAPCNSEFLPKIGSVFWARMFLRMSVKELAVPLARSRTQILHDYLGIQGSSWSQVTSCIDWWSGMWSGPGLEVTESKTRPKPQCLGQLYSPVGDDDTSRGICWSSFLCILPSSRLPVFVCARGVLILSCIQLVLT